MPDFGKRFYVNVGKNGTFQPSGNPDYDTTASDIDGLFDDLKQQQQKKILLYFHGGLVSANSGMETANRIFKYVSQGSSHYPVAFVWETGLVETVSQNFNTIGQSAFFKKLLPKIIKAAAKQLGLDLPTELGAKGIGTLTDAELQAELLRSEPFEHYQVNAGKRSFLPVSMLSETSTEAEIENTLKLEVQADLDEIMVDEELIAAARADKPAMEAKLMPKETAEAEEGQKGIFSAAKLIKSAVVITIKVIQRFVKKRDHGFYPTIIEEVLREFYVADLGSWVWGSMKNKAKAMWTKDDFSGADSLKWHAGTYFVKKLEDYQKEHGPLSIDLIGHSAGSIAICELLRAVSDRQIKLEFRNVVFMAPACRAELFYETVLKKLQQQPTLVKKFRCYTMSDSYEMKDHLVPGLYTRSLLYFISGVLEEKAFDAYILGLQRHITGESPYHTDEALKAIKEFLAAENSIVYSVTDAGAAEGLRSTASKHGNFDNDQEATLDSIVYLINQ